MKKFIFTALMGVSALAFSAGAMAEGKSALQETTQLNSDASPSAADNSVAHGTVDVNTKNNSISATSTTGTKAGTASGTIVRDNSANGIDAEGKVGYKNGDDDSSAMAKSSTEATSDEAKIDSDMTTKTGVMKTRAKGALGMLSTDEVKTVQENLISAGYSVKADGVLGKGTKNALKEYQKSKNLHVTGKVDADTRSSMGMSN